MINISLNLIGVLLLQISCFYTFAEFDISNKPEKVDYCKNFPKNQFGQTVDIDCAFTKLVNEPRASNGEITKRVVKSKYFKDYEVSPEDIDERKRNHSEFPKYVPNITYWGAYGTLGLVFPFYLCDFGQKGVKKSNFL